MLTFFKPLLRQEFYRKPCPVCQGKSFCSSYGLNIRQNPYHYNYTGIDQWWTVGIAVFACECVLGRGELGERR